MSVFSSALKKPYDVVIIGGGPAGLSAAKCAAETGASVMVLEEHGEIGLPHHCSGWIWDCKYSRSIFEKSEFQKTVLQKTKTQRAYAPSGRLLSDNGLEGWVVDRAAFDKVIAKHAAEAGADISLNTKVTSLVSDVTLVKGVVCQNAGKTYEVAGKVVIGADGMRSLVSGSAKRLGLAEPRNMFSDVQVQFENVENLDSEAIEIFMSPFPSCEFGFLSPIGESSCYLALGILKNYDKAREEHKILKAKLEKAVPVALFGGMATIEANRPFKKIIKDGFMLAGDAAGYVSAMRALISGHYAGKVAAGAVKDKDISTERLSEYNEKRSRGGIGDVAEGLRDTLRAKGFEVSGEWRGIEKIPIEIIERILIESSENVGSTAELGVEQFELIE